MRLVCQHWGNTKEEKPRVVFLHGMGGTGALWRPIAAGLEDHFEILAPDQRGHGASRVTATPGGRDAPSYTPLDYGRDVVETLDALKFHPTWIVGHSMGVRTACAAAYLKPEWIQGLVLIDLGFSGVAGGGLGEGLGSFLRILPAEFENRDAAREFMARECPDPSIAQYLMAVSMRAADGRISFLDRAALVATIEAARDASVRGWVEKLGGMSKPVLVLRGEKSLVWTRSEFEAEKRHLASFPSIVFEEFAGASHGLPFEKRPEFIARVRKFFGQ